MRGLYRVNLVGMEMIGYTVCDSRDEALVEVVTNLGDDYVADKRDYVVLVESVLEWVSVVGDG